VGAFHCPVGAPFRDGDGCILCGLCQAGTKEEMVKATEKIRAHFRAQAQRRSDFKKVAICGKGGTGKSTIATLIAGALSEMGQSVLVIDTDESNPGLCRMLGFDKEPRPLMNLLSRFSSGEADTNTEWIRRDQIAISDIPSGYILEKDGLRFMMVGKIEDPLQGCACTMADMTREFVGKLLLKDNEVAIIDSEAGIESFGRGVERSIDTVLVVIEPSFDSIAIAEKISFMADGIGVKMVKAILNKIPSEEVRKSISETLVKRATVSEIGTIHFDADVSKAGFGGDPLGESRAKEEMKEIIRNEGFLA
jgi:CO dehydrogenase maturation factor